LTEQQKKARKSTGSASGRTRGSGKRAAKGARLERREVPLTVFIHIPKTAGTTLTSVLRANFPPGTARVLGNVFHGVGRVSRGPIGRLRQSGHVLTRDIHLLGGHIPFGVRDFLPPDSRYITFLRNPVERTLSHYYRLLSIHRGKAIPGLPEEPSLEQLFDEGQYLHDNLQTRMLSGIAEPFDEVTEEMLEQAKENLSTGFVAFGLTDRFDESLVLLKRALGLRSVVYVSQRMTTARPRTAESKTQMMPVAERYNAYDMELYRWAAERFDQTVAQQDPDFVVDLGALRLAVSGGTNMAPAPAAAALNRQRLWEELVKARAELLGWEYDNAKLGEKDAVEAVDELRGTLEEISDRLGGLESKVAVPAAPPPPAPPEPVAEALPAGDPNGDAPGDEDLSSRQLGLRGQPRTVRLALTRERKETHLEELRQQIDELEDAVGLEAGGDIDPHVLRELERLRGLAAEAEEELRVQDERRTELQERELASAERAARAEKLKRERRRTALAKRRGAAVVALERGERRVEAIREQLTELGGGTEGTAPARRTTRMERLEALAREKEKEVEQQREKVSAFDQELAELGAEEPGLAGEAPVSSERS
jgi:hypothetical protein